MGRPCEEVILISDHEEGEITDSDVCLDSPSPPRKKSRSPDVKIIDTRTCYLRSPDRPSRIPIVPKLPRAPRIRYSVMPSLTRSNFRRSSIYRYREIPNTRRLHTRVLTTPFTKKRLPKKYSNADSSYSDSDTDKNTNKKAIQLGTPKKCNSTSLRSRLSNMIKYSTIINKTRNIRKKKFEQKKTFLKSKDRNYNLENSSSDSENNVLINEESNRKNSDVNSSDDDAEILRERALKSKFQKSKNMRPSNSENVSKMESIVDPGDIDTEIQELRLAALKSAMIQRAVKRKRIGKNVKKRKDKMLTTSNSVDDICNDLEILENDISQVESSAHEYNNYMLNMLDPQYPHEEYDEELMNINEHSPTDATGDIKTANCEEDPEENEEILRSNLLASMKNVSRPPLVQVPSNADILMDLNLHSSLIVRLGGSDSESECEETKNLTIMHKKLTEQTDFQRHLDLYLKGVRHFATLNNLKKISRNLQNEYGPDSQTNQDKTSSVINNLTKSDQQEYKELLIRMQELEKSKQLRETSNTTNLSVKSQNEIKSSVPISSKFLVKKLNNVKQVLKPSQSTNETPNSILQRFQSHKEEPSNKVFEQQLNHISNKIGSFSKLAENQKNNMKSLQVKKTVFLRELKKIKLALRDTDKAIMINHQSSLAVKLQLDRLHKQKQILLSQQNRNFKYVQKKSLENIPPLDVPNLTKSVNIKDDVNMSVIPNIDHELNDSIISNNIKTENQLVNTLMISVSTNMDDGKREIHIQQRDNQKIDAHSSSDNIFKESDIELDTHLKECNEKIENIKLYNDNKIILNPLILPLEANKSIEFTEYNSSLLEYKNCQSWNYDPQAILCPFDVDGCCKDPTCTYVHLKLQV